VRIRNESISSKHKLLGTAALDLAFEDGTTSLQRYCYRFGISHLVACDRYDEAQRLGTSLRYAFLRIRSEGLEDINRWRDQVHCAFQKEKGNHSEWVGFSNRVVEGVHAVAAVVDWPAELSVLQCASKLNSGSSIRKELFELIASYAMKRDWISGVKSSYLEQEDAGLLVARDVEHCVSTEAGNWFVQHGQLCFLPTGQKQAVFTPLVDSVRCLAVQPAGEKAFVATAEGSCRVFNLIDGVPKLLWDAKLVENINAAVSVGGGWAVISNDHSIWWFLDDKTAPIQLLAQRASDSPARVRLSADQGGWLEYQSDDGKLTHWQSGVRVPQPVPADINWFIAQKIEPWCIHTNMQESHIDPDVVLRRLGCDSLPAKHHIVVSSEGGIAAGPVDGLWFILMPGGRIRKISPAVCDVSAAAISDCGTRLHLYGYKSPNFRNPRWVVYDMQTGRRLACDTRGFAAPLQLHGDGEILTAYFDRGRECSHLHRSWVLRGGKARAVSRNDTMHGGYAKVSPTIRAAMAACGFPRGPEYALAYTEDSRRVAFSDGSVVYMAECTPSGWALVCQWALPHSVGTLVFFDELLLASTSQTDAHVLEVGKEARKIHQFPWGGATSATIDVQFANQFTAFANGELWLFNGVPSGRVSTRMGVGLLAASPDGRLVVSTDLLGGAQVWNAETGHWIRALNDSRTSLRSICFSSDSRFAALGCEGLMCPPGWRLWDLSSGELIHDTGEKPLDCKLQEERMLSFMRSRNMEPVAVAHDSNRTSSKNRRVALIKGMPWCGESDICALMQLGKSQWVVGDESGDVWFLKVMSGDNGSS